MACGKCDFKGFVEASAIRDEDGSSGVLMQCRHCNDIDAYSKEVQRRMSKPKADNNSNSNHVFQEGSPCKVIPFPFRRKNEQI